MRTNEPRRPHAQSGLLCRSRSFKRRGRRVEFELTNDSSLLLVSRLVEDVPSSDPRVSLVPSSDLLPEVDSTSLEVSVLKE